MKSCFSKTSACSSFLSCSFIIFSSVIRLLLITILLILVGIEKELCDCLSLSNCSIPSNKVIQLFSQIIWASVNDEFVLWIERNAPLKNTHLIKNVFFFIIVYVISAVSYSYWWSLSWKSRYTSSESRSIVSSDSKAVWKCLVSSTKDLDIKPEATNPISFITWNHKKNSKRQMTIPAISLLFFQIVSLYNRCQLLQYY